MTTPGHSRRGFRVGVVTPAQYYVHLTFVPFFLRHPGTRANENQGIPDWKNDNLNVFCILTLSNLLMPPASWNHPSFLTEPNV